MITDSTHAQQVQTRRRESGKKGRSKAVRRWAKRECGTTIDADAYLMPDSMRAGLKGDFTGCRPFQEARDLQAASYNGVDFYIDKAPPVLKSAGIGRPWRALRPTCKYCAEPGRFCARHDR